MLEATVVTLAILDRHSDAVVAADSFRLHVDAFRKACAEEDYEKADDLRDRWATALPLDGEVRIEIEEMNLGPSSCSAYKIH